MYLLPAIASTPKRKPLLNVIHCVDALVLLRGLSDGCIDAIVTDPPYATTNIGWDRLPDQDVLFTELRRVLKHRGVMAIFGTPQTLLRYPARMLDQFRYHWIWQKTTITGHLNAKVAPLRTHEMIFVFSDSMAIAGLYRDSAVYYPQMEATKLEFHKRSSESMVHYASTTPRMSSSNNGQRYPKDIINFPHDADRLHPTQKPVRLMEYLVKTYTRPADVVLDPFMGSGTTALAARNTERYFIGSELNPDYVALAKRRLAQPFTLSMFDRIEPVTKPEQLTFAGMSV